MTRARICALLVAIACIPATLAGTAQADTRVRLTPASGVAGTAVTLVGAGFGRSDPVKIKAGHRILAKTRTNRQGRFKARFKIFERHRKPLRVLTISRSRRVANFFRSGVPATEPASSEIAFGRTARLRWSPQSGAPQSPIGFRGSHFRPRQRIRVTFAGKRFTLGRTGRTGGFARRLTVPNVSMGSHPVRIRIGGTQLRFSFEVTRDPLVAAVGDIACDPQDPAFNGGIGTVDACHMRQTAQIVANASPDLLLVIGDAQYNSATLAEFRASYEPSWGQFKDITRPVPGNHEYGSRNAADYFSYFGAAAGDPQKGYYSFNIGAWHVIALNSNCTEPGVNCAVGFAQEGWLRADLQAHRNRCVLAFWHHEAFGSGQHGNHPTVRPFFNALYEMGADLVLVGHEHDYERFAPQTPDGGLDTVRGIRQFLVGTGGRDLQALRKQLKPNSEASQDTTYGVLMLRLHPTSYDWEFTPEAGKTFRDTGSQACH
jgi:calcineurin-like phosphoesterase family protein